MSYAHVTPSYVSNRPWRLALPWPQMHGGSTLQPVTTALEPIEATARRADAALLEEEARLAHAAAAGDGSAFATLYERYERRAYNLAYRVTGSEHDAADAVQEAFLSVMRRLPKLQDRELAFGSYLFTATRHASYDLIQKHRRTEPSDAIPESAAPVGAGAGGLGLDPGDPEEDPSRKLLLESQQEEIREANSRLPERQREALALCELEELSYDEIAEILDMNRNSVAQLISRARIKLRDELRGTALASIAASSPDCEYALPLIAMRDDGQLDEGSEDADWLDAHILDCHTCNLGLEAMQEAGASYRAWTPIVAAPWLLKETMAKAAELTGADWSAEIAARESKRADLQMLPGIPSAYLSGIESSSRRRRGLFAAIGLGIALLVALLATALGDERRSTDPEPVLAPLEVEATEPKPDPKPKAKAKKEPAPQASPAPTPSAVTPASSPPASSPTPETDSTEPRKRKPETPAEDPVEPEPEPDPDTPVSDDPPVTEPPVTDPPVTDPPVRDPNNPPPRTPPGSGPPIP